MATYQIETKNTDLVKNYQWKKGKFIVEAWIQAEEREGSTSPIPSQRKSGFWSETVVASERRSPLQVWLTQSLEMGHPTGLLALVKHRASPWLTCGVNPLLDLSLFSQLLQRCSNITRLQIKCRHSQEVYKLSLMVFLFQCIVTCVSGGRICTQDMRCQCWQFFAFGPR